MEKAEQKEEEDIFRSLENDFQLVLCELIGDKSLDKFRVEYEKVAQALRKSHDSEKRLMAKCRELTVEIKSSSTKAAAALRQSQEDQAALTSLKKEVEKAWKMFDTAQDEVKKHKEVILSLQQELKNSKMNEQHSGKSEGPEDSLTEILKMLEEGTEERDQLRTKLETLEEKLSKAKVAKQEVESQREADQQNIFQLQQEYQVQHNKWYQEMRLREKLEKEVKQLHVDIEASAAEAEAQILQVQRAREEEQKAEQKLKELKLENEQLIKEMEQEQAKTSKLQQESRQLSLAHKQLRFENQQITDDLKMKEDEMNQMRLEIAKLAKTNAATQKKLQQVVDDQADVDELKETLKTLKKELEASQKQVESGRKTTDELIRERDLLHKNIITAAHETEKQQSLVKIQEQDKKHLEQEIHSYRQEAQKQRKIIQQLERDRDRYVNENNSLAQKVQKIVSDIELKERDIFDYKKKITEAEHNLQQHESQFERVVKEKNSFSKNLLEAQDEITETKKRMKMLSGQVMHLRNEVTENELAMAKDQLENERLNKDNENLKGELQSVRQKIVEFKQEINGHKAEEQKLHKISVDADAENMKLQKQLDQIIRERDIIGQQLLRRNDERTLLCEKIKILQAVLTKGNLQYSQRLGDIHLLKLEIKGLQREISIMNKDLPDAKALRQELFRTQRELLCERKKCSVFRELQKHPPHMHRWRYLEASDPSKYELIQKMTKLQKRLIAKTQEVVDNRLLIQEKERLYMELKKNLARRPGLEVAEQLQQSQWTVRDMDKKLKALTAEVRMLDSVRRENMSENQKLANELAEMKRKFLAEKQLNREQRAKDKQEKPDLLLPPINNIPHFIGGGFRISNPQGLEGCRGVSHSK
ncbi:cilia- and flagella-associated protein 58-like [Myripristis murdjan]|uniref:cilia- and flagella-associated protein 58-like n=1 Tax=Myripristis murdjan TaxID=586833 RepID=UPI001175F9BD|nr:cilia- and flagella-associated protein 58-like [Myripristis murdjan]